MLLTAFQAVLFAAVNLPPTHDADVFLQLGEISEVRK